MSMHTMDYIPMWDVADRMRKSLRDADVGVTAMADYLEVSRNTVGNYINGHTTASGAILRLWALRCGVSLEWLKHGDPTEPVPAGSLSRATRQYSANFALAS